MKLMLELKLWNKMKIMEKLGDLLKKWTEKLSYFVYFQTPADTVGLISDCLACLFCVFKTQQISAVVKLQHLKINTAAKKFQHLTINMRSFP